MLLDFTELLVTKMSVAQNTATTFSTVNTRIDYGY